ncbi:hypothetical protein GL325_06085 [Aeromicrobium sp. 636]|uniref:Uncharacterized protein n=1 Tax=Aeromicrobium senzhongii TaxID=2663859 RepID=A0A8I0EV24_9ACTN|nr:MULTISPECIES: hypothetical protein [Aeromicrobium]MBC9225882.1 hypothetical protein [Aeromicrobium senzhongii]MCQ3997989.1 hypothetical protein [Aeromicrobium sp. 636]MTB87905.1 hypothetical protein [Aeromicrobium senzhongii]QNL95076.1 hypothetical protein H9L21_03790 [Aeromicrobium senzhongii]
MNAHKTLLFTTVTSAVLAVAIVLLYPVLIEPGDDFEAGLLFFLLLVPGLGAGVPIIFSAVVHARYGRTDRWVPGAASVAVVVAVLVLLGKDGSPGNLLPTGAIVIAMFVGASLLANWAGRRFVPTEGGEVSGGR